MATLQMENVLSMEQIQKYRKEEERVKKLIAACVGTGAIVTSSFATQFVKGGNETVQVEPKKEVQTIAKEEKVIKPATQIASEVVYSSEKEYGKVIKTASGKMAVGSITKEEHKDIYESFLRIVSSKKVNTTKTAGVYTENGVERFNPYVTYITQSETFAPQTGKVIKNQENILVIEHTTNTGVLYSIIEGAESDVKPGEKVERGQLLGQVSGEGVKYAVAKKYENGEFFEFVHPNRVVDTEGSNSYRYGSFQYYNSEKVTVAPELKGTKVEQDLKKLPKEVLESNIVKGVVIENADQLKLLKSSPVFYSNDVLPKELIENGKAKVSPQVRKLEPIVRSEAKNMGIENMTEFLLALLQHESGGLKDVLETDPFQSSQSKNEVIGSIQNQRESIAQGIKHFKDMLNMNNMNEAIHHGDIRQAIHSYNFGGRVSKIANEKELGYSVKYMQEMSAELAVEYNKPIDTDWRGVYAYGDFTYTAKVFNFFEPSANWKERAEENEKNVREKMNAEKEQKETPKTEQKPAVQVEPKKESVSQPVSGELTEAQIIEKAYQNYKEKIDNIPQDYAKHKIGNLKSSNLLNGKVIVIDAGHGAKDVGAVGIDKQKTTERNVNLEFSFKLEKTLSSQGAKVIMTRTSNEGFMEPAARGIFANNHSADLLISIHNNAAAIKPQLASGFETLYNPANGENQRFAQMVHTQIQKAMGLINDRGLVGRSNLGILNASKSPSILLELGFMTNPYDLELIKNDEVQQSVVNGVAIGVKEYLGLNKDIPAEEPKTVEPTEPSKPAVEPEVESEKEPAKKDEKPEEKPEPQQEEDKTEEKTEEKEEPTTETKDTEPEEKEEPTESDDKTEEEDKESGEDNSLNLFDIFKPKDDENKDKEEEEKETPETDSDEKETEKGEEKKTKVSSMSIWDFISNEA